MSNDYFEYSSDEEIQEFRRRNDEARRARQRARKQIMEGSEEGCDKDVRQVTRDVRNRIYDDYYEAARKSKLQDKKTLDYIDAILNETSIPYTRNRKTTVPIQKPQRVLRNRRGSHSSYHIGSEDLGSNVDFNDHPSERTSRNTAPPGDDVQSSYSRDLEQDERGSHLESTPAMKKTSETARQRVRRIEARLDGILDYELPSAESFKNMRHSLREINDKMATHKLLLDRQKGNTVDDDNREVTERIDQKYRELEERMPCLSTNDRGRNARTNAGFDPTLIPGYVTGLSISNSEQTAELRGRIRTLLCRTKRTAGTDEKHTSMARRRREISVK